jgi:hypothetical protein
LPPRRGGGPKPPAWSRRAGVFGSAWRRRRRRRWTAQSAIMAGASCAAGFRGAAASSQGAAAGSRGSATEHSATGALWDCGGFDERRLVVGCGSGQLRPVPSGQYLCRHGGTYPPSLRWASSVRKHPEGGGPLGRLMPSHVAACAVTWPPRGTAPRALRGSGRLSPDPEVGLHSGPTPSEVDLVGS